MFSDDDVARYAAELEAGDRTLRQAGATEEEISVIKSQLIRVGTAAEQIESARRELVERAEARRMRHRRCLENAGCPEHHLRLAFDVEPKDTDAVKAVREFLTTDMGILVLLGGVGTGKTTAAVWGMSQLATADDAGRYGTVSARFITAPRLADASGYDDAARELRSDLERTGLLIIDDLGTEYGDAKGFFASKFSSLIDTRFSSVRKTLVTTNLDAKGFALAYGDRVVDRVRESGRFYAVSGKSMRTRREFKPLGTMR